MGNDEMTPQILNMTLQDQLWVIVAAGLVFLMQAGFLCVEAGMSRAKHSMNVAIKNVTDYLVATVGFYLLGYRLMFGRTWGGIFGTTDFAPQGSYPGQMTFFLFQLVFCGTATTIVSGAMAERMKFSAYLIYSAFCSVFLYPLFGHWVWGGAFYLDQAGWLARLGYLDFAGSSVVHQVGGWVSLAGIVVLGPRLGKFDPQGRPRRIIGHDIPLALLGVFILWFGWIGFNGGSTLQMNERVGSVIVNTNLGGAAGALIALAVGWPLRRRADIFDIANGALGGLVAITASAAYVQPLPALIIGAVAGVTVVAAGEWLERGLKLDDVVGAVAVHGFCGLWGILAVALFAQPEFLRYPGNRLYHLGIQALGSAACFTVAFGGGWVFFALLNRLMGIRVSPEGEKVGLNFSEHHTRSSVQELAKVMQEISAEKQWTQRAEVDPYSDVGELGEQFNGLLETIERTIRELEAKHGELRKSHKALVRSKEDAEKLAQERKRINEELQSKMRTLEVLNRAMMGREERILELKERIRLLSPEGRGGGAGGRETL